MATFKAIVKARRKDGFYPVYIRVTHQTKLAYIVTDKLVNAYGLSRTGEIEDPYVLQYCTRKIIEYVERLNKVDIENWSVREVVSAVMIFPQMPILAISSGTAFISLLFS